MDIKEGYKNIDAIIEDVAKEMATGKVEFIADEMRMFFHAKFNEGRETYNVKYHVNGEKELAIYSICDKMKENPEFAHILVHAVKMFMEDLKQKQQLQQVKSQFKPLNPDVN